MTDRELMQMALDAGVDAIRYGYFEHPSVLQKINESNKALRDRLAQPDCGFISHGVLWKKVEKEKNT